MAVFKVVRLGDLTLYTLMASVQGEVLRTSDLPTKTEWADYDLPLSRGHLGLRRHQRPVERHPERPP